MKRSDDDQPEKKENQGRSDKKQTVLTKADVATIVKDGLNPLALQLQDMKTHLTALNEALGEKGILLPILSEIRSASQAGKAQLEGVSSQITEMVGADEHRETRLAQAIHEASSKDSVAEIGGQLAGLLEAQKQDGIARDTQHAEVLGRFNTLDQASSEILLVSKENAAKLAVIEGKLDAVATTAGVLTDQLDQVLADGKKLRRWAFTVERSVGSVRELIGSESALTRDNFGEAMEAGIGYLAGELGEVVSSAAQIQAQIKGLPGVMGEALGGKFGQMIKLADKMVRNLEVGAGQMTHLSNSTSEAFKLHRHMLASITSEAKQAGASIVQSFDTMIQQTSTSILENFKGVDEQLKDTFKNFDPEKKLDTLIAVSSDLSKFADDYETLTSEMVEARDKMIEDSRFQAATIKAEHGQTLKTLENIISHAQEVSKHFDAMQAGYKDAEGVVIALNNRVVSMGIENYQRDMARMRDERDKARQEDREFLIGELKDAINPMIDEAISKVFRGWLDIQNDAVEQAEPNDQR